MVNKQKIKDTAFRLFARKGFVETSTENIASAVGLKKQSLYSHFKSKNEIIMEVMQEQSAFVINKIDKYIKELYAQPPEILFKGIFMGYIDIFLDRDRLMLWKRVVLVIDNEEYQDIFDKYKWQLDKDLSEALFSMLPKTCPLTNRSKFQSFFISYMLLIQGYLDWMILTGYDEAARDGIWDNFWNGTKGLFKFNEEV